MINRREADASDELFNETVVSVDDVGGADSQAKGLGGESRWLSNDGFSFGDDDDEDGDEVDG